MSKSEGSSKTIALAVVIGIFVLILCITIENARQRKQAIRFAQEHKLFHLLDSFLQTSPQLNHLLLGNSKNTVIVWDAPYKAHLDSSSATLSLELDIFAQTDSYAPNWGNRTAKPFACWEELFALPSIQSYGVRGFTSVKFIKLENQKQWVIANATSTIHAKGCFTRFIKGIVISHIVSAIVNAILIIPQLMLKAWDENMKLEYIWIALEYIEYALVNHEFGVGDEGYSMSHSLSICELQHKTLTVQELGWEQCIRNEVHEKISSVSIF